MFAQLRPKPAEFHVFDTTLRDGSQQEGLNLSVADKLTIAGLLDELGVGFIEGGWPGANPNDTAFFAEMANGAHPLRHATLVAFGFTRRVGMKAADDPLTAALRDSGAPVACIVAKSHDRHVEQALRTTLRENLDMIADTVSHLRAEGQRVFVDCEHFFDGYRENPGYAVEAVRTAAEAGAEVVVLCDTNGGMLPQWVGEIVTATAETGVQLGIHAHNDTGCAVANTLAAVDAGAMHVQGTVNGYGERTGNAELVSVVANLELKYGWPVLPPGSLPHASRLAHAIAEVTNVPSSARQPYVGLSSFAHKAGLHASAIKVDPNLYQHIDPALVGNDMRMLVSDMAGRASIQIKGGELGFDLSDRDLAARITDRVKEAEAAGYTYESADASFELLLRRELDQLPEYFTVQSWRVFTQGHPAPDGTGGLSGETDTECTVRLSAKGQSQRVVGEGNGPVNALDHAVRNALLPAYPVVDLFELIDYRVRILDQGHGTDATVRVLIQTTDGRRAWTTVGVGQNIVEASWEALSDAYLYGLIHAESAVSTVAGRNLRPVNA
ncbi:MAG: (R)-citramalate synthase [uncultured Friedmanniella sp.]|uniref:Citramalate synthase n=1 Tax=uncultured Friedmanniella sp. TaxID=335381 RepID=A0A6J4KGC6_9ACTN|nr:citramalate synthase [uncultured Friedmanniella sp.]CAA9304209.1 MAG: (R)-citramalate synthase [uncultured Friedmanniella sp.]